MTAVSCQEEIMEVTAIITILALLQFIVFSVQVGAMRAKHGIKAPATSGHPDFERMHRVQQNTLEQLIVFVPALWMFAYFADPLWAAAIGGVFIIGRVIYRRAYLQDPATRSMGFTIGILASAVLLLGSLVAIGRDLL
jgi:glutathione S-transferase